MAASFVLSRAAPPSDVWIAMFLAKFVARREICQQSVLKTMNFSCYVQKGRRKPSKIGMKVQAKDNILSSFH